MDYMTAAIVCVVIMFILLMLGLPVPYALLLSSVVIGIFTFGNLCLDKVGWTTFFTLYNLAWTPLPLFVFLGCVIAETRMGEDLYYAARNWLSDIPGGLVVASIFGEAVIAAALGASAPTILAVGKIAEPEFERYGYNKAFAVAALVCGGALGPLIPPSATMIIYAVIANVAVGRLFIAGIIPGIIMALMLAGTTMTMCMLNPSLGPRAGKVNWKVRFSSLTRVWPVIVVMIAILGSIYTGIATPTESAGLGCTAILIIAIFIYGLRLKGLYRSAKAAAMLNTMLMFVLVATSIFTYVIGSSTLADKLTDIVTAFEISPIFIVFSIMIVLIILGCFIDGLTIMMLTIPIFVPLVGALGFDRLWFGILFVVNMEIGVITPPMGINLLLARNAFNVSTVELLKYIVPFITVLILLIIILAIFPEISLWLPGMMLKAL
jgi:C4-dicarboxylate transporter DctM subunit